MKVDAPDSLVCSGLDLFDADAAFAAIRDAAQQASDSDTRTATVARLNADRKAARDRIAAELAARPFAAEAAVRSYAWLTDGLVRVAWRVATELIHPLPLPSDNERLSVIAVGGYGRGEMAPYSDVDLLFLTPWKITARAESVIETMLYILWDLRLKVGHSSRTVRDCLRLGTEDFTIRTAMLECRHITGDAALSKELTERLWSELFSGTEREFVAAKLAERATRLQRHGGQRYLVEPNLKEGKGGLRDLQSLFWITKYVHKTDDTRNLVQLGVFRPDEYATFERAHSFLWATRCHLHLVAGRATEQLTFDMQVEVADRMGYLDTGGRRAVEHFMQDYFLHATRVGELTRIVLTALEADQTKDAPLLTRLFQKRPPRLRAGYEVVNNRLALTDPDAFLQDKVNLLRLFEEAMRTGLLIHPDAMRLVAANLHLIDDEVRNSKDAQKLFLNLLLKYGNPERALRRMNELGVLAAFIPEFEPIVAMMQFNMYHHYTVDEHTIQTIRTLAQIEHEELVEELPVASSILAEGVDRKVLYVALLCHDIGKGRDQDHAVLGAQIARTVAPRLGLNKAQCETVEWLVRYHLLMSDMAQKRDIADPRTVRDFAKAVQTVKRLDLLCVLTVCDIRGVGPNTWNNWKATLIRALYRQTRRALEEGMEALTRENRGADAKRDLREALQDWPGKDLRTEIARHYDPYWQGLHVTAHVAFAKLLHDLGDDEIRIDIHPDDDRDATRACFAMADHPGIFARLAGALALVGANVVDARSFTTKDGYVTAAFWLQDIEGKPYEASRLPRLRSMIQKTLAGEVVAREAIKSRDVMKKREKAFSVPTSITFDNEGSDIYTLIEVDTRDRPGLLYDLARTMTDMNINIFSAVVATYGEQVVDTFYVKDMFGLKFYSESKQRAVERRLREAILQGAERAKNS
ncbi:protein-PII uridylyltransferase [Pseudaestuariivita atlantica]|uniref:Bifunctional uridylyltransferase/uridylyl-removing enzyme n=1 Tax=Pseudaestuariivita atlantica TaxID=1317121 RepID=A0A0L1JUI9_9RHOB|nr:protein-PII uridylyltransferase [Pseudaestuariivita atlantica]